MNLEAILVSIETELANPSHASGAILTLLKAVKAVIGVISAPAAPPADIAEESVPGHGK